jgi:tetratricopeptide (TPR) repeat protein
VIGKEFWLSAVSAVGEIDGVVVEGQLARLEEMDLIRRDRQSTVEGESQFTFQHVLVRDVAYGQVTHARRAEKHRRAAEWLHGLAPDRAGDRAEMLGRHYLNALRFARLAKQDTLAFADPARKALREAGTRAWWLGSHAAAADFCRAALELTVTNAPDRPELLFQYGRALFWAEEAGLDEMTAAVDAMEAQGDAETAAVAASWASKAFWMHGDRDGAYRQIERALVLVSSVPVSPAAAEALTRRAGYDMFAGRYSEAIRRSREALPLVARLGLEVLRGRLLNIIGTSRVFDGDPDGVENLEQSLEVAVASNSAEQIHSAYENLFSAQMQTGRLQEAAATFEAMSLSVARRGAAHERRWLKVDGVRQGFATGDWDKATRLADEFLAEVDAGSPHYLEAPCRAIRSAIALARGDLAAAISASEKALAAGRRAQDIQVLAPALWAGASVLLAQADRNPARDLASELLRGAPSPIWNLLEWGCVSDFAWLTVDLGLGADTLEIVADVPQSPWARAAEAIVAGRLPEAVSLLADIGDVPGEARTRLRLAAALARNGRRQDARTMSLPAMDFYTRVGARTSAEEAESLATGAA